MDTVDVAVANGATLLDEHRPGWAEVIDLEALRILSCTQCVLGQLYGRYGVGLEALGLKSGNGHGFALAYSQFPSFGFNVGGTPWEATERAWAVEVEARRSNDWVKAEAPADREMVAV